MRKMAESFHSISLWRECVPGATEWNGLIYWQEMALLMERHSSGWVQSRRWTCRPLARAGPFSFISNFIIFFWLTLVRERRESVLVAARLKFHLWLISQLIFALVVLLESNLISSSWGIPLGLPSWCMSAATASGTWGSDRGNVISILKLLNLLQRTTSSWGRLTQSSRLLSWVCRFCTSWDCCGSASHSRWSPRRELCCCVTGVVLVTLFTEKTVSAYVASEIKRTRL